MGIKRGTGRSVTSLFIFALLLGTAWTGRASVARVDVDPALHSGAVALIQVVAGTAWTVAANLTAAGATEVATFDSVNIVSARLSDAALASIGTDRSVLRATTDAVIVATGGGRNRDLDQLGDNSDSTSIGNAAISAPNAWSRSTGAGVVVALMDSGIGQHPDLPSGKVVARANFVDDGASALDPAGHGTHLAGIIAANGATFRGVAPDARLVDLRVLDKNGDGRLRDVIAAFDWLLKNRKSLGIGVLNLSIGMPQDSSYHADLLAALAEAAWFSGVAVVAAAGNDGPVGGRLATPGSDPFVITAGSLDDQGSLAEQDDRESLFSSRGPSLDGFAKPDVLAPGRRVVSLRADPTSRSATEDKDSSGKGDPKDENKDNGRGKNATTSVSFDSTLYVRMSGTSVSSAMTAGVAALVLSHHTDYSPTKVKSAIVGSGRNVAGSPRQAVDAMRALSASARTVNKGLLPSRLLMQTLVKSGVAGNGTTWEGVTWEGVTWEAVTWEAVTWEGVSWESVSWESVSWEGVMWETVSSEKDPLWVGGR
ncbi:MAG TPA: S8 family serine peptidase [Candidatus Limnocylindria bacterium]|nr:S8 family serine peptidase [Candidatus Limnocylindria bacterium]